MSDVAAVTKPRRETRWNFLGYHKLPNRSQPLEGRRSPYFEDTWRRYYCLTSCFYLISIHALLNCEDIARQSCAMVRRRRFWDNFCVLCFQRAACSTFQTYILNSHYGHSLSPIDIAWDNAFRKIFNGFWRESVKPLLFYCKFLPIIFLANSNKLLFWKKLMVFDNPIVRWLATRRKCMRWHVSWILTVIWW